MIRNRPWLVALILAAALALRVLVPGGYMPTVKSGTIIVTICTGSPDGRKTMEMTIPGLEHKAGSAAEGKCAYADLAQALTGSADPVLLAAAIAFILALALIRAPLPPILPAPHLRPPLRGPPARR
ncbi:hypothetical protein [Allosphingosinicella indica]|uniref:hypothetical protein n=1 Tax=Allosphingosinicella indica TaxID=941907 RepID=UPI001FCD0997|nr:hypothetical protein [Allosphingosinicella indica]